MQYNLLYHLTVTDRFLVCSVCQATTYHVKLIPEISVFHSKF
jgi:hypothetical protein